MREINFKKKSKRGLSEIVSYVLLIVIALSIAVGVYAWMKYYLPNGNEGKCPDDTALTIKDYNCSGKILSLILQNSGYFTVDGFYIRASNETDPTTKIPTITLNNTLEEYNVPGIPGRCNLQLSPFNVSSTRQFDFEYYSFNSLTRVQIQPYVITNNHLYLCKNKVTIDLQGC